MGKSTYSEDGFTVETVETLTGNTKLTTSSIKNPAGDETFAQVLVEVGEIPAGADIAKAEFSWAEIGQAYKDYNLCTAVELASYFWRMAGVAMPRVLGRWYALPDQPSLGWHVTRMMVRRRADGLTFVAGIEGGRPYARLQDVPATIDPAELSEIQGRIRDAWLGRG